ncbi:hypothetical protein Tco_0659529, partial [Tanacetum coccineum]
MEQSTKDGNMTDGKTDVGNIEC